MTTSLRKGWCPGALRPMAAKDGLLVRLRITGGILAADKAIALADLARRFGNGAFDLSARGNLQIRGASEATLPMLQDGLAGLGLIDDDAAGEAVRNVVASPLAGLHAGLDIRPLTVALEQRLAGDAALHALPAKFGFLIDDGSAPSLAGIDADVRFDWLGRAFSIGLGNDATGAVRLGRCTADALVEAAVQIAEMFLERFGQKPSVRRMRDVGAIALRDTFRAPTRPISADAAVSGRQRTAGAHDLVGWRIGAGRENTTGVPVLGLAAPFGRFDTAMLRQAARIATTTPHKELRLTPWRVILVPGASEPVTQPAAFITDPGDPRLAVAACVGKDGCSRGTTSTRSDAVRLARDLGLRPDGGLALHISGCAKGCAKATPSPMTLVARDGRYDLVRNGLAGDPPWRRGLDVAGVREVLAAERA